MLELILVLPIMANTRWTCTMDAYIHCQNMEARIEDTQLLEKARDYARLEYIQDVDKPFSIVRLLDRLKQRGSIKQRSETKYPTVGDLVAIPSGEVLTLSPDIAYDSRHVMCIIGMHDWDFVVAVGGNIYDVIKKEEHHTYYTFK